MTIPVTKHTDRGDPIPVTTCSRAQVWGLFGWAAAALAFAVWAIGWAPRLG